MKKHAEFIVLGALALLTAWAIGAYGFNFLWGYIQPAALNGIFVGLTLGVVLGLGSGVKYYVERRRLNAFYAAQEGSSQAAAGQTDSLTGSPAPVPHPTDRLS